MVSNNDIIKAGVDVVLDKNMKPFNDLAEKIALGDNYHKIRKAKKLIKEINEVF